MLDPDSVRIEINMDPKHWRYLKRKRCVDSAKTAPLITLFLSLPFFSLSFLFFLCGRHTRVSCLAIWRVKTEWSSFTKGNKANIFSFYELAMKSEITCCLFLSPTFRQEFGSMQIRIQAFGNKRGSGSEAWFLRMKKNKKIVMPFFANICTNMKKKLKLLTKSYCS